MPTTYPDEMNLRHATLLLISSMACGGSGSTHTDHDAGGAATDSGPAVDADLSSDAGLEPVLRTWMTVESGSVSTYYDVWGRAADDVWAVGAASILHWDGAAWSATSIPDRSTSYAAVWAAAADDAWAVGSDGTIVHWDGASWTATESGTSESLQGVWGFSATDVWAVGNAGTVLHWDGATWSAVTAPTAQLLMDVWGLDASDVWASGTGTLLHWDGASWSSPPNETDTAIVNFAALWGSASNDVWAVGDNGGTIVHWDGAAWSVSPKPVTQSLSAIAGSSANDVWAFGLDTLHWDGSSWTLEASQGPVWGALAFESGEMWAVGEQMRHYN